MHAIIPPTISHGVAQCIYCRGAEEYQLCVDCVIDDNRMSEDEVQGTKYDWPGTVCAKGPICVHEFYHRLGGDSKFNIRARTSQNWTPWSADRIFTITTEAGTVRETMSTHNEL